MKKKKTRPGRSGMKGAPYRNRSYPFLPSLPLEQIGEIELLKWVRSTFSRSSKDILLGIGDDAACYQPTPGFLQIITADLSIEGVHFDRRYTTMEQIGYRALASNLSDIAAMGGIPKYYLLTVAFPKRFSAGEFKLLYKGMARLAQKNKVVLAGGDLSSSRKGVYVSITVLGEIGRGNMVTRSGAKAGDRVFVTGTIGDSAAGLEILKKRLKTFSKATRSRFAFLVRRHLNPTPRLREGHLLASKHFANAMIDLSDGLATDLRHICKESGVRAEVDTEKIPLSTPLRNYCSSRNKNPVSCAMTGGEDYELLFTVSPNLIPRMKSLLKRTGIRITEIGRIFPGSGVWVKTGKGTAPLIGKGFEHFH